MPSFYTGDELGNIKHIACSEGIYNAEDKPGEGSHWKLEDRIVSKANNSPESTSKELGVQRIASSELRSETLLSIARANGSVQILSSEHDSRQFKILREWKGKGSVGKQRAVGMNLHSKGAFWCSSNGSLSFSRLSPDDSEMFAGELMKGALPMNLRSWQLSSDAESFCYGGTEVDLSVWDTTRSFSDTTKPSQTSSDGKKRGRGSELFPAETWRAKNLPNDNLNLRQPIDTTSITYLASSSKHTLGSGVHLVTGTQAGDVRRYDTRAARKPVANWAGIGKVGGVSNVKAGLREHELYVSDNGSNLSTVDLRNGRVVYSYKQIQGTISDIVVTSSFLASTSQDRFFRLHSTVPPSETAGQNQDARGKVLSSLYMKSIPTAVALDPLDDTGEATDASPIRVSGEFDEDPWEGMQDLSDDEDNEKPRKMRRRPKK